MQAWMNDIYGVFKGHVVAARGAKLKKPIDELAGGRVYTGRQALDLGLVDKLGSLDDAIRHVAKQAKLEDYQVRVYPEPKSFFEVIFEDLSDGDRDTNHLTMAAPALLPTREASILDLALPHLKGLDGERLETIQAALRRLDLLGQQRAVLMMPEITVR
jgi:protease-4